MRWKLDLLLWPRDQGTEFLVEACWLSRPKKARQSKSTQKLLMILFLTALAWSSCTELPLDWESTRNTTLRFQGSSGRDSVGRAQYSSNRVSGISSRTMHQSTTLSLSQTIWPIWASRHFLSLPIVPILLPVTFGYSLTVEAVVRRQLRRWKRLWRRSLTRSHKRTSMGPSRSYWNGTTSALQPEEIISKETRFSYVYYQ